MAFYTSSPYLDALARDRARAALLGNTVTQAAGAATNAIGNYAENDQKQKQQALENERADADAKRSEQYLRLRQKEAANTEKKTGEAEAGTILRSIVGGVRADTPEPNGDPTQDALNDLKKRQKVGEQAAQYIDDPRFADVSTWEPEAETARQDREKEKEDAALGLKSRKLDIDQQNADTKANPPAKPKGAAKPGSKIKEIKAASDAKIAAIRAARAAGQVPDQKILTEAQKGLAEASKIKAQAANLRKIINEIEPGYQGPIAGLKDAITKRFGKEEGKAAAFRTQLDRAVQTYRRLVTGQSAGPTELKNIMMSYPQVMNDAEMNLGIVDGMDADLDSQIAEYNRQLSEYQTKAGAALGNAGFEQPAPTDGAFAGKTDAELEARLKTLRGGK